MTSKATDRQKGDPAGSPVEAHALGMAYPTAGGQVEVLRDLDLTVPAGEFIAVTGASGCGKSTLLNLLGALDHPTSGTLSVGATALHEAGENERVRYRREEVGFVFQFFNLLPSLDVIDNVALPLRLQGIRGGEARNLASEMVEKVGLSERGESFPATLSGGEMQRAAVARALVHGPGLLLADEPTGNLDSDNAGRILELFTQIQEEGETTIVMVTHSPEVAAEANREVRLEAILPATPLA